MDKILKFFGLIKVSDIEIIINMIDTRFTMYKLSNARGEIDDAEMNCQIASIERIGFKLIENKINGIMNGKG